MAHFLSMGDQNDDDDLFLVDIWGLVWKGGLNPSLPFLVQASPGAVDVIYTSAWLTGAIKDHLVS